MIASSRSLYQKRKETVIPVELVLNRIDNMYINFLQLSKAVFLRAEFRQLGESVLQKDVHKSIQVIFYLNAISTQSFYQHNHWVKVEPDEALGSITHECKFSLVEL